MKKCIKCETDVTPQWYSGPVCKSCYRKAHRSSNIEIYQERDRKNYENNKDYVLKRQALYYQNNKEACKERSRNHRMLVGDQRRPGYHTEWRLKNPDKQAGYMNKYQQLNREKCRAVWRQWNKEHASYRAYYEATRRARKLQATPAWLSQDQLDEILKIYASCPKGYHVDHIVPLQGESVCGLHVPWNLQHLPATENLAKGNKMVV